MRIDRLLLASVFKQALWRFSRSGRVALLASRAICSLADNNDGSAVKLISVQQLLNEMTSLRSILQVIEIYRFNSQT